jgi:hypothetical protein
MSSARRYDPDRDVPVWKGSYRPYDIAKELTVCFLVVLIMVVGLAIVFGSPDDRAITIKRWSNAAQVDFAQTAITELDGTSGAAGYGPPYNDVPGTGQKIGPLAIQSWVGVHIPVNPAQDFVLGPLGTVTTSPVLTRALAAFRSASPEQQAAWEAAYEKAVGKATVVDGQLSVPSGAYGPVGIMIAQLTEMARSGALDTSMISASGFYGTDYTKPLLFVADSTYLADQAAAQHLSGDQWGMMNETGSYPGQPWLWLYTMWYQVPPFSTSWSPNADALIWALMMVLTLVMLLVPFIPGLRSIPRWSRIYRVIWRDYYKGRV